MPIDMETNKKEFLLSEYTALRQEVLDTLQEVPKNERLALVLCAVFWSWFVVKVSDFTYLYIVAWLPFAFALLLYHRARSLDTKFNAFHKYLLSIEKQFELGDVGWEQFLEREGKEWFAGSSRPFWYFLLAGNFILGVGAIVFYVCSI
jgi:hypothetical protein